MTHLLLAVMGQAKYVCAVHRFIQDLLLKAAPEFLKGSGALKSDAEFKDTIDAAIASVTTPDAKERDYIRALVEAASDEMKPLCGLLKGAAGVVGLGTVADRYLDGARFREMLLRRDEEKLERLNAIVQDQSQAVPVKVLMDVAAELDGRAENYDGMDAAAKRKASREMKKLIGKVEEMRSAIDANTAEIERRIDEGKKEIVSHVDEVGGKVEAVGKKVDRIRARRRRKSKYTDAQRKVCSACWDAARRNVELRYSTNGIVTHETAFSYHARELASVGVTTLNMFCAVLHSVQNMECTERKAALEAKREAERKAKKNNPQTSPLTSSPLTTKKPKCGKIRGMKKRGINAMIATALAVFGASGFGAVMPQLPEPVHADAEVWTNVPCAQLLSDVKEFETVLDFTGTASNCVQVAFGRDDDGNGDLSADETDVAIGWRAGDWFVEDVKGGRRFRESFSHGGTEARRIEFRVAVGEDGAKSASVVCDGVTKFGEALGGDLRWLYDRGWNMARVTRRGVDSPGEIVLVASDHGGLKFIVR